MENETLYGGDPYDILDCTRNLFVSTAKSTFGFIVTKYSQLPSSSHGIAPASSSGASFSKPSRSSLPRRSF